MNSNANSTHKQNSNYSFLLCSSVDRALIVELLNNGYVDTPTLEKVSGLSRSATLARMKRLVKKGFVMQSAKASTEHWLNPHYQFAIALSRDRQLELAEFLGVKISPKAEAQQSVENPSFESQLIEVLVKTAKAISDLKSQVASLEKLIL